MIKYRLNTERLSDSAEFTEAYREELRVLLVLIELDGRANSVSDLAEMARVTAARASAALAFWSAAGVIYELNTDISTTPSITDEYEEHIEIGAAIERGAASVAAEIKNNDLAALISECARIMKKPALSTEEAKQIVSLYTDYSLDEEYIVTLAAFLAEEKNGKLGVPFLARRAVKLVERGIYNLEALEAYITTKQDESYFEYDFKSIFGIHNRVLSESERAYADRWFGEYGFDDPIVNKAFSFSTEYTGDKKYRYMDKIITAWYEAGCKTVEECVADSEKGRSKMAAEKAQKEGEKKSKTKKTTPRYGDFDVNDAFAKALQRSYGDDKK